MSSPGTIQVSGTGGISFTVSRAATALQETGQVILCGINSGIPNVVQAAELLKHKLKGLHQLNMFEKLADSNKTRVSITLSLKALETTNKGYQAPIPEADVQVATFDELKTRPQRPPREERKAPPRSVASSDPTKPTTASASVTETPGEFRGRGRGRRGRGRGRRSRGGREPRGGSREPRAPRESRPPRGDSAPANKYRKVRPPKSAEPPVIVPGELHISPKRPTKYYVKDAVLWIKKQGKDSILLKASGWAIGPAVAAAEDIKRAIRGVYQVATYSKRTVTDEYEPTEAGLEKVTKERTIPALEITLSVRPLNTSDPGYQAPLPDSQVKEMSVTDAEAIA